MVRAPISKERFIAFFSDVNEEDWERLQLLFTGTVMFAVIFLEQPAWQDAVITA